jgi:hypothetical protein
MKKYGVPTNKLEIVTRNLISSIRDHLIENDIKTVVIAFQKNAASPLLASLLRIVRTAYPVELISLSLLKDGEKLPEEILDSYGDNIYALSDEEKQFYEKFYSEEEYLEIQLTIARNTAKTYENSLFITDVTRTELELGQRLLYEQDFRPFQELSASEIFELAEHFLSDSKYCESLEIKNYYNEVDQTLDKYKELKASKNLPQINKEEIDTQLQLLEENPFVKLTKRVKQPNLPSFIPREKLFKFGEGRLD